ncbi:MAG: alanine racemase [bacterium]
MASFPHLNGRRPRSCWLEIDLDSLRDNLQLIRRQLNKSQDILAVVKAEAYGHGAEMIARVLSENNINFLGVATLEEALKLREFGIETRILIMGHTATFTADEIISNNLTPMIYSYRMLKALEKEAKAQGKTVNIHLKVDTGMGRLGLLPADVPGYLDELQNCFHLNLEGVATHFPVAGENKQYTDNQITKFREIKETITGRGIQPRYWHLSNSAAILSDSKPEDNLVRPGITLYGYPPHEQVSLDGLKPVMEVKSKLADFKQLQPGHGVSYGRRFTPEEPTYIGVLPLGYADGYPRDFSNRAYVLKSGRKREVLGSVCMDMTIIKLDADDNPEETVTVMGQDGELELWADTLAEWHDTIVYEILTRFSQRLPRIYFKDNKTVAIKTERDIHILE